MSKDLDENESTVVAPLTNNLEGEKIGPIEASVGVPEVKVANPDILLVKENEEKDKELLGDLKATLSIGEDLTKKVSEEIRDSNGKNVGENIPIEEKVDELIK